MCAEGRAPGRRPCDEAILYRPRPCTACAPWSNLETDQEKLITVL